MSRGCLITHLQNTKKFKANEYDKAMEEDGNKKYPIAKQQLHDLQDVKTLKWSLQEEKRTLRKWSCVLEEILNREAI